MQVAGYKVKVMLAEPKTRRGNAETSYLGLGGRAPLPQGLLAGMGVPSPYAAAAAANASLLSTLNPGLMNQGCVWHIGKGGGFTVGWVGRREADRPGTDCTGVCLSWH